MKKYLLDTNTLSDLENQDEPCHKSLHRHLSLLEDEDEAFGSVLSLYEMQYGAANSSTEEHRTRMLSTIQSVRQSFPFIPLSETGAEIFGSLKSQYRNITNIKSKNIARNNIDFMLAASAIENNAILVSTDGIYQTIRTFRNDFVCEDWTSK